MDSPPFSTRLIAGLTSLIGDRWKEWFTAITTAVTALQAKTSLVYETTVSGSAATSIDITGLDINTHKSYRVEIEWINSSGTSVDIQAFINNDTTSTNYYRQVINADAAAASPARVNSSAIMPANTGGRGLCVVNIALVDDGTNAYAYLLAQGNYDGGSIIKSSYRTVTHVVSVSNITQLTFTTTVANGFSIGTKLRIYRGDI